LISVDVEQSDVNTDIDLSLFDEVNDADRNVNQDVENTYPFTIPAIQTLETLEFNKQVTFFVGENGSGKSTLIEAIAVALGFNPEGGTKNFGFSTRESHSPLHKYLRLSQGFQKPKDGFFLRAESYFNVASNIEALDREPAPGPPIINSYGGVSLHEQSHGESFMSLVENRFGGNGIYVLDEPESALSPNRQMSLLTRMKELVDKDSQFIVATHSPILLAYPEASIYQLSDKGIEAVEYKQTQHYKLTKMFLDNPERMTKLLFEKASD